MAELLPPIRQRFYDDNGDPLAGGKLYSYEAGTTTPKATYVDRAGVTTNANPIILDADGYGDVWIGSGYYKFVLTDSSDVEIWTKDQVALASEAALASAFWRDVVYITSADSPFTVTSAHNGKLISIDTTSGSVSCTLPQISSVVLPYNVGFKKTLAANTVTITRSGTDTIDGATSKTLETANAACQMIADIDKAPDDWSSLDLGTIADGAVTTLKIADSNVTRAKLATGAVARSNYVSATGTYAVASTDDTVVCSGASFTATLPTAASLSGKKITIIHNGTSLSQVYTLATTSAQTIGGIASGAYALYTSGEMIEVTSDGTNWIISNRKTNTASATYTPDSGVNQGLGTVASPDIVWSREGIYCHIHGLITTGTVAASEARLALPAGITSASDYSATSPTYVGESRDASDTFGTTILIEPSKGYLVFGYNGEAGNGLSKRNGNIVFNSSSIISINAKIRITGWQP